MTLFTIITALNGILAIAVAFFALWKNPQNTVNRAFTLLALSLGIWGIANILPLDSKIVELIVFGAISLATAANLHFTHNLINSQKWNFVVAAYFLNLIFFGIVTAKFFGFLEFLNPEILQKTWLAFFLTILVIPAFLIFTASQDLVGVKKFQLKFMLLEYLAALAFGLGIFVTFYNSEITLTANFVNSPQFLSGIHLLIVFYFFVEWKFLKLKVIAPNLLKKLLAFGISIAAMLAFHFTSCPDSLKITTNIGNILTIAMVILVYNSTLHFFRKQNWFQAVNLESFRKVVTEFQNQNIFYASVEELEENIQSNFSRKIGIEKTKVMVRSFHNGRETKFPQLKKYFEQHSNYLVTTEEEYLSKNKHVDCPYLTELKKLGDVCFPLFQNTNKLIGFIAIKGQIGNDIYIEEELKLLTRGAHYVALALMGIIYTEKLRQQTIKLRSDYEKLRTLDNAKDAFIANVSHELRTPATAIKGYAEMIAAPEFGKLNKQQKDFSQRVQKNTNWLLELLKDILKITKLESEQVKFKFEKVEVQELIKKVVKKWEQPCEEKKLKLSFNFEPINTNLAIKTDPRHLQEILERLLTNSHKFTQKGGITIFVKVVGKFLEIAVKDSGIGIASENLSRVWDKFFQSKNFLEKSDAGTGLGLAIIKKLVENLHGKIFAKSETGKGSTFTLLIPL